MVKKLLVVGATKKEYELVQQWIENEYTGKSKFDFSETGVGMMTCTYHLTMLLARKNYDLVIQIGIAGSFSKQIVVGDVVEVTKEHFGDLGAEDNDDFITLHELGFGEEQNIFTDGAIINPTQYTTLKTAVGLTVNKSSGAAKTIARRKKIFNPDIETMEGGSFFYVCKQLNQPGLQIRGISNFVTPRNKEEWEIPLAITNANKYLIEYLKDNF